MSDKLQDYIRENRSAFDQLQPPDIWHGVAAGIKQQGVTFKPKNYKTMIRYGFGASAIVVASFVALFNTKAGDHTAHTTTQANKLKTERTIFDSTPSVTSSLIKQTPLSSSQETKTPTAKSAEATEDTVSIAPVSPLPPAEPVPAVEAIAPPPATPPVAPLPPPPFSSGPSQANSASDKKISEDEDVPQGPEFTSVDSSFKDIRRVEVNGQVCNVTITSHNDDAVKVRGEIKESGHEITQVDNSTYKRKEYKIKMQRNGDLLKVWIVDHTLEEKTKRSNDNETGSYLNLQLPEATAIKVFNCSGNITVSGPFKSRAELKSSFGNIKADNISADLKVSSSSGNITVSNITGKVESNSSFGNQKFDNITGNIVLRSSSGEIIVHELHGNADVSCSFGHQTFSHMRGDLKTVSSSGNVTVEELTGNASVKSTFGAQDYKSVEGDIVSSASSGDIKLSDHKGQLTLSTSFGSIRGKNITLKGNSEFKASSGNISMNIINNMEDLRFDLVSSSGNLSIDKADIKKRSDNKLQYGGGPILIKGVSSFGNQNYN